MILALWTQVQALMARVAELEAKLGDPPKTPANSGLPPSKGQKANPPEKAKRVGPRQGSLGRKGGRRPLVREPDETVTAKAASCAHCRPALTEADQVLHGRYDRIDLPVVRPVVTRAERYTGHCQCCGGVALAPVTEGMEEGSPFSINILMAGNRPGIWVSDLYGAEQGHADLWQVCLAHQLRDCEYAIEAGDAIFAPRMKMLLLRAVVLARRRGIWPNVRGAPIYEGWIAK